MNRRGTTTAGAGWRTQALSAALAFALVSASAPLTARAAPQTQPHAQQEAQWLGTITYVEVFELDWNRAHTAIAGGVTGKERAHVPADLTIGVESTAGSARYEYTREENPTGRGAGVVTVPSGKPPALTRGWTLTS
ncbi:MAG: hypothetical protein HY332_11245 [Chloroflexi bacterium]|nr:hypothetical protein [Chloroflexota bacterium]